MSSNNFRPPRQSQYLSTDRSRVAVHTPAHAPWRVFAAIIALLASAWAAAWSAETSSLVGTKLPETTLFTTDGKVTTAEALAGKPTVIAVFRGGWCPYCTKHLQQLQKAQDQLTEHGYQLLAVAPDSPENLATAAKKYDVAFSLLADTDFAFSNSVGLTFAVDEKTQKKYKGYGIPLLEDKELGSAALPEPALIIVDATGHIAYFHKNVDYKKRITPKTVLAEIDKLK